MAAPKPISEVLRRLAARYVWDTAHSTIISQTFRRLVKPAKCATPSLRIRKLKPKPSPATSTLISRWTLLCSRSLAIRITSATSSSSQRWWTFVTLGQRDGDKTPGSQRRLGHSRKQSAKRVKVGSSDDSFVDVVHNQPKEEVVDKTTATYLINHLTLTVAHAKAGSMPIMPQSGSLPREV